MSDVPNLQPVLRDFSELQAGGELSKAAHHIERAEKQCQASDDIQGCHDRFIEELSTELRKKYRQSDGPLGDLVGGFDVVGAVEDSLVFRPRTKGESRYMELQADALSSNGLLRLGSDQSGSEERMEFSVRNGQLQLKSWTEASHVGRTKVGPHEFVYDTRFVNDVDLDANGRIAAIETINGVKRIFRYDKSGHLDAWGVSNGVDPLQYWVRDTQERDKWNLYIDKDRTHFWAEGRDATTFRREIDAEIEEDVMPIQRPSDVWHGKMKMTRGGNFILRRVGEHKTHVETINGRRYEY